MKRTIFIFILSLLLGGSSLLAQTVSDVSISGNFTVGKVLSGNYLSDPDSLTGPYYYFRWIRKDPDGSNRVETTNIGQQYTLTAADLGKRILFIVNLENVYQDTTVTDSSALSIIVIDNQVPVANNVSIDTFPPNMNVGTTLLGVYTYSDQDLDPEGTSTFRWLSSSTQGGSYSSTGTTSKAYTMGMGDQGKWFKFEVTPIASSGKTTGAAATSSAVGPVNSAPSVSNVTINGTLEAGQTVNVTYTFSDADGDSDASEIQWYLDDVSVGGATSANYTILGEDEGKTLKVIVTPKSATGYPDTGTPGQDSHLIAYSSAPVASNVVISGQRKVGQRLTGHWEYSYVDGGGNQISQQRNSITQWYKDGVLWKTDTDSDLSDSSPLLTTADMDKPITFRITPRSKTGSLGSMVESAPMAIFNMTKTEYSVNDSEVPLVANPAGGEFSCADTVTAVYGGNFHPNRLEPGTYTIKYTLELTPGTTTYSQKAWITLTVTESVAFFESFKDVYCSDETSDIIYVRNTNKLGPKIMWQFALTNPAAIVSIINDSTIEVNPNILGPGNKKDALIYTYQVLVGTPLPVPVTYQIVQPFVVDSVGTALSISNVDPEYCQEAESANIFSVNMYPPGGTGSWTGDVISNPENYSATLDPGQVVTTGLNNISYTYTTPLGCTLTVNTSTTIHPTPVADFSIVDDCIEFPNDTTLFLNSSTCSDPFSEFFWTFGDNYDNISSNINPGHLYRNEGIRQVSMVATSIYGCRDTVINSIDLGVKPHADFRWEKDCFHMGEDLLLFDETFSESPITGRVWDFNEGTVINDLLATNPTYPKTTPGTLNVDYYVLTAYANCSDTVSKTIYVRPSKILKDGLYEDDFETLNEWIPDTVASNSWLVGTPDRPNYIKSAASGSNAWYTAFNTATQVPVNYAVESPCFDFREVKRPMIKMKLMKVFDKNRDGAALQYRIGDDPLWTHLGTLDDGINWYNSAQINGRPGGTQIGWTSEKNVDTTWTEARHKLDNLIGMEDVKLRIVYGSDGTSQNNDGFAFDDIWIGERTRMVLVEHFTNNASTAAATHNPDLNDITGRSARDMVNIQYHTGYPGSDSFFSENPDDHSARALFYGLSRVPFTYYDGGENNNLFAKKFDYDLADIDSLDLNKRSMVDPLFSLNVNAGVSGDILTVSGDMTALGDLDAENMTLYVAVVLKEVTNVTGANGETAFKNVLRQMLPTAGGTNIKKSWLKNETLTFGDFSWPISHTFDATEIEAVVFLQNNITKEVYQAATSGISTITSVPYNLFEDQNFSVYPNPASDHITVSFGDGLKDDAILIIYNASGLKIMEEKIFRGDDMVTFEGLDLPGGLYVVRLEIGGLPAGYKKFIVTK